MVPTDVTHDIGFDRAMLVVFGHTAFALCWAGVEHGVFELLEKRGSLSEAEAAERLELRPIPARILLDGLAGLGLLTKTDGSFQNTSFASRALTRDGDSSLVDVLAWQHHIVYPAIAHLSSSLK